MQEPDSSEEDSDAEDDFFTKAEKTRELPSDEEE